MFVKVKTEAEKMALVEQERAAWEAIPPELRFLVAPSCEDYLEKFSDTIEVEHEPFTPARELTSTELAKQDGELMFGQIFGDRADDRYSAVPAFAEMEKAQEQQDLEKILGPARSGDTWLEQLVREAINKVQSVPRRERDRTRLGIIPRAAAASVGDDSDVARFLRAYVANDVATQREIARSLAAA